MHTVRYEIISRGEEWFVIHEDEEAGPYVTKEAAFQAVVPPISLTIADGHGVDLHIESGVKTRQENA